MTAMSRHAYGSVLQTCSQDHGPDGTVAGVLPRQFRHFSHCNAMEYHKQYVTVEKRAVRHIFLYFIIIISYSDIAWRIENDLHVMTNML